jgi:hypothetical protein
MHSSVFVTNLLNFIPDYKRFLQKENFPKNGNKLVHTNLVTSLLFDC